MVCTTSLNECEQNVLTQDEEINELIQEVRDVTNKNWQVVENTYKKSHWFKQDSVSYSYRLYVEVGGFLPFQVIIGVRDAPTCKCYLYGLLSGLAHPVIKD